MAEQDTNELFLRTLSGNYEDEGPWEAVRALRRIGTREVFDKAVEWCQSDDLLQRARGADVIAQLGKTIEHRSNRFPEESYSIVSALLLRETQFRPLASAIAALGHLDNPAAVPLIANFYSHPSAEVRFSVACALGSFPDEPLGVETLLLLMQDTDADVRDWATFGLGVLGSSDSAEIREALVRGLNDSREDVREEAMVGLGKRKDQRVLSALLPALEQPNITDRVIEAADLMLGIDNQREGWKGTDYVTALRKQFSLREF
jgi:HEAT repeat protein